MNNTKKLLQRQDLGLHPEQKSAEWLRVRQKIITSTNGAAILEENNFQSPYQLLVDKVGGIPTEPNIHMEHGNLFEPVARRIYEIIKRVQIYELGLVRHKKYKFLGASPDGLSKLGILLEIKCPLTRYITDVILRRYWVQMQLQMEVCDLDKVDFMECKFKYYDSKEDYDADSQRKADADSQRKADADSQRKADAPKTTDSKWRGTISTGSTFSFTIDGDIEGEATNLLQMGNSRQTKYWYCNSMHIINVKRSRAWFKKSLPHLRRFNNVLQVYRKRGIRSLKSSSRMPYKRWDEWVAASKTRNYIMDDPLLDWLDMYGPGQPGPNRHIHHNGFPAKLPPQKTGLFSHFIRDRGNDFEKNIITLLKKNHGPNFIQVGEDHHARSSRKFMETFDAMKRGTPIIYKGVLHDSKIKVYGMPDLIVRADYLSHMFNEYPKLRSRCNMARALKKQWHYVIVDIKLKRLSMHANGSTLGSNPVINSYKAQLYIYTRMLNRLQRYNAPRAYILGNGFKFKKCGEIHSCDDPFEGPGVIDFGDRDCEFRQKTRDAVIWIRDLRRAGRTWSINPPSIPELYPNMSNQYDTAWRPLKNHLANELKEITALWQCGPKNRRIAHRNGVFRWDDPKCISEMVGHDGTQTAGTLQAILDVNQENFTSQRLYENRNREGKKLRKDTIGDLNEVSGGLMEPEKIASNLFEFRECMDTDLYVDFETIPGAISGQGDIIFAIGVGWITNHKSVYDIQLEEHTAMVTASLVGAYLNPEPPRKRRRRTNVFHGRGKWNYKCFMLKEFTPAEEKRIIVEFNKFAAKFKKPRMFHWGHIEETQFAKSCMRHLIFTGHRWCNLLTLFRREPIVVRGALNFSIKSIGKAMHKHDMIETTWGDEIAGGLDAAVQAYNYYTSKSYPGDFVKNVKKYNMVDVKIMWEIVVYLREMH